MWSVECIEAAGEEGFSQPRCVEVINRPAISASCSVAFSQKKTPESAQSNAQVGARLGKLSVFFVCFWIFLRNVSVDVQFNLQNCAKLKAKARYEKPLSIKM